MDKNNSNKDVVVKLSIKPEIEKLMLGMEKNLIEEDLENIPPIKEDEVYFHSLYMFDNGEEIEVSLYILNGLSNSINFERLHASIVDEENETVITQIINFKDVGIIPAQSVRPHKIYFDKSNMSEGKKISNNCKIVIGDSVKAISNVQIDMENVPTTFNATELKELHQLLEKLPLVKPEEVSITAYNAKLYDGNIYITLLIRNGKSTKYKLDTIPISVYDSNKNKVVGNVFRVDNIELNPYKARLYNFIFTKEEFQSDNFDFKNITVDFKA